jgi:hypothetical protein
MPKAPQAAKNAAKSRLKALLGVSEEPAVNRIDMSYKDVTKRVPELTEGAQAVSRGDMSAGEYDRLVNRVKPVTPYGFVPEPATTEDAMRALTENKRPMFGKVEEIQPGEQADLRLDIPAYRDHGVWVNSIHRKNAPTVYGSTSSVKNATMIGAPEKALRVATGETPKAPFAVIRGDWNPMNEAESVEAAKQYLNHPDWRQVGYDPERHGYFYDRQTMEPILGAEEVIQIGPLVLAKKPQYGKKGEQKYSGGGALKKVMKEAITSAAEKAGMKAPQLAEKDLTTLQDFHTSLGDRIRARVQEAEDMMKGFDYKYSPGQHVFTEDSARKNLPPMKILDRTRTGYQVMREDMQDPFSKKIIDPATGRAKRTPYEPGYRVRMERGPDDWSEFTIPQTAIKGDVEMAGGGVPPAAKSAIKRKLKGLLGMADEAADIKPIGKPSESESVTAAQRAEAGRRAADVNKATAPMRMSEALGNMNVEGKGALRVTQSDRTRVGGGNIGGAMFPGLQQVDPFYEGAVWGVGNKPTASGLINQSDENTLWSTLLGSADQLKTNPIVFNKLRRGFTDAMKEGRLSDELADKINHNLALKFGEGADIRDPKIWRKADTFDKRALLADLMMGWLGTGRGEKRQRRDFSTIRDPQKRN